MSNSTDSLSASRMGTAPVAPLLLSLAIPMMISMLVQALYNVVDSIFVSRIGEDALSAVSLAFPVQNLMIAFAVGTAVGVNALLSKCLGEQNQKEADRTAMNGLFLAVCSGAVFLLFGVFGVKSFMFSQTGDAAIRQYGIDYLSVCCTFGMGMFIQCMFEKILVSTGRTSIAMVTQLIGAITNIILDPIFIFGLLGAPKMGAAGAAIATVLGQCLGAVSGLIANLALNKDVNFSFRAFRPSLRSIRKIYSVGIPSIGMNAIGSVMTLALNGILISFSSTAVAVFGVYFKLQSFVFMPIFGLNNGLIPIVGYNFGARKPQRIVDVVKIACVYAIGIMAIGLALAQFAPGLLLGLFDASPDMLAIGTVALRTISWSFLLAGFNVIASACLQALGHGMLALWASVVRQLVVLIPAAWLLSLTGSLDAIWWSFPIAELAALVMCALAIRHCYRKIITPMLAEQPQAQPAATI